MNNIFKTLEKIVNLMMEFPIRTIFAIFFTLIFIAISMTVYGACQLVFTAFWFLIIGLIVTVSWDEL